MSAVKELQTIERREVAHTPMELLNHAVSNGNIELAEKLMALQERWEKNQARKAFDNAMAEAKSEIPVILKNRQVTFGQTNYSFEDMAEIARTVDPILATYGMSYRFRTSSDTTMVTVTCIISHRDGHSEENGLSAVHDMSGSKNKIQAVGSTITYLQRYTLKAALGLAAAADEDGRRSKKQNPHVTAPSDVIEPIQYDDQGRPIDNIPLGDKSITRLSKSMARPDFAKCQTEIRATRTVDELQAWGEQNANRVESFPHDWQEFMRDCYREQIEGLRGK